MKLFRSDCGRLFPDGNPDHGCEESAADLSVQSHLRLESLDSETWDTSNLSAPRHPCYRLQREEPMKRIVSLLMICAAACFAQHPAPPAQPAASPFDALAFMQGDWAGKQNFNNPDG